MDTLLIWLEFAVLLAYSFLGSRYGGVGLGLWGSFGVFVLTYVFGLAPTSPPIDVMLIILAVIMAASVMEAAGGIDYLVSVAASIIQRNPKQITVVAPLVSYAFTFGAGTGHIFILSCLLFMRPRTITRYARSDRSRSQPLPHSRPSLPARCRRRWRP